MSKVFDKNSWSGTGWMNPTLIQRIVSRWKSLCIYLSSITRDHIFDVIAYVVYHTIFGILIIVAGVVLAVICQFIGWGWSITLGTIILLLGFMRYQGFKYKKSYMNYVHDTPMNTYFLSSSLSPNMRVSSSIPASPHLTWSNDINADDKGPQPYCESGTTVTFAESEESIALGLPSVKL